MSLRYFATIDIYYISFILLLLIRLHVDVVYFRHTILLMPSPYLIALFLFVTNIHDICFADITPFIFFARYLSPASLRFASSGDYAALLPSATPLSTLSFSCSSPPPFLYHFADRSFLHCHFAHLPCFSMIMPCLFLQYRSATCQRCRNTL